MSFEPRISDTCPLCYKSIVLSTIEPSPSRSDCELHNFTCADCGNIKTKVFSLKPSEPSAEPAAYAHSDSSWVTFLASQSTVRPLFSKGDTPTIILLVEDSLGDIRLTREAFAEAAPAPRLYVTENGAEAMAFLRREGDNASAPRPDLILLDLNMPIMDGREGLALIKNDKSQKLIPIVILTTSDADADVVESYQLQANSYLKKPVELDVFEDMVKSMNDFGTTRARMPQLALVA